MSRHFYAIAVHSKSTDGADRRPRAKRYSCVRRRVLRVCVAGFFFFFFCTSGKNAELFWM